MTSSGVEMSPFSPAMVAAAQAAEQWASAEPVTPFAEALTIGSGTEAAGTVQALLAEFEDEQFDEAVAALTDETVARYLHGGVSWAGEAAVPVRDTSAAEAYLADVAGAADRMLAEIADRFGGRAADTVSPAEIDAVAARHLGTGTLEDAQEQFLGGLVSKIKKVASGVGKIAKKGLEIASRFLPIVRVVRGIVPKLLNLVMQRAIGSLPASLQPIARTLAARLAGKVSGEAEFFDQQVAAHVTGERPADPGTGDAAALSELDEARSRLAADLAAAAPGESPTAQMEQFLPAVLAVVKPLIGMGLKKKVISIGARILAPMIKGMVGEQAAKALSRHIVSTGLTLIGLEAEAGGPELGAEALVAATEDAVREVLALPAEALADDLLVEAETQDAFARAAARHLPGAVLRPEVAERDTTGEEGVWVMMPRTRHGYRYKKYSRTLPVRITAPVARGVHLPGGDTLEQRLLDAGVPGWPVHAELEMYELLDGGLRGHVAAYEADPGQEAADAAGELEPLDETAAGLLAGNPGLGATTRRLYRLRVPGTRLRRHRPFAVRLDLTAARPALTVHLRLSERTAHLLSGHLEGRRLNQIVPLLRARTGPGFRQALARRLERSLPAGTGVALADRLADAMVTATSKHLPGIAAELARAAQDPAPGVTLSYAFAFTGAIGTRDVPEPALTVRPGAHRD